MSLFFFNHFFFNSGHHSWSLFTPPCILKYCIFLMYNVHVCFLCILYIFFSIVYCIFLLTACHFLLVFFSCFETYFYTLLLILILTIYFSTGILFLTPWSIDFGESGMVLHVYIFSTIVILLFVKILP